MAYFKCNNISTNDAIFGDGSLGNLTISSNKNASSIVSYTDDTGAIVLNCNNFVLNSGFTLTADKRNAGLIIRTKGDCTIRGTIINRLAPRTLTTAQANAIKQYYPPYMYNVATRAGNGGAGGAGGAGMTGRFYGGGYGGGGAGGRKQGYDNGGAGGSANTISTSTSIFVGGASVWASGGMVGGNAGSYGGGGSGSAGGGGESSWFSGYSGAGGSGAGGEGGYPVDVSAHRGWSGYSGGGGAGNYGGGVVLIYCQGNLYINGAIYCNGSNGGNGNQPWATGSLHQYSPYGGSGGGGGGGGRIYLLAKGSMTRSGTFNVNAGSGGSKAGHWGDAYDGVSNGGAGGDGNKYYTNYIDYKLGNAPTAF